MKTSVWFRPRFAGFRGYLVRALLSLVISSIFAVRAYAQCDPGKIWVPPQPNAPIHHPAVANQPIHHPAETHIEHTDAVIQHYDAVVVEHPAVTHTEFDEFGNPYEVEDSPAWTEVIADAFDVEISPARDDVVVDVPGWDEPVPDTPAWDEPVADTPGYCRDAEWTPMEEITSNHGAPWSPALETVADGQPFFQSRLISRTRRTWERSELGDERNFAEMEFDVQTCFQPAVGTAVVPPTTPPPGGTGTPPPPVTPPPPGGLSVITPPANSGTTSFWRDVNGDGYLDEIISSTDPRVGLVLTVEENDWGDDFVGHWSFSSARDGDRVFPIFSWSFDSVVIPEFHNPWATMDVIFAPEPGREYIVWSDSVFSYNNDASRWPAAVIDRQTRRTTADIVAGSSTVTVSDRSFLSFLAKYSWYLIRLGKPDDEYTADIISANSHSRSSLYPYAFGYLPESQRLNREELHAKVGELRDRVLNSAEMELLIRDGCIALARIMMKRGNGGGLSGLPTGMGARFPEEVEIAYGSRSPWKVRAFISYEQTENFECPPGHRELVFAKWGAWKNGVPPTPNANGEVPADSVWGWDAPNHNSAFNYLVLINGKWLGINHAGSDQSGFIYTGPPQPNFPTEPLIFIKVCIPN